MGDTISSACRPGKRCHRWRDCEQCARIRQARIADRAEGLLRGYLQLQLIVIKPTGTTPAHMQRAIRACIRNNGLRAGIWTIEQGDKAGTLHANLLTHGDGIKPARDGEIHASQIRSTIRATAAYISKRRQSPDPQHYGGKTFGTWGRVSDHLHAPDLPALVVGAVIEADMPDAPPPPASRPTGSSHEPPAELTVDQYREIAARHLPHLAAMSASFKRSINRTEKTCINRADPVP